MAKNHIFILFFHFISFPLLINTDRLQSVGVYYGNWDGYAQNFQICSIPGDKIDYLFYAFLDPSSGTCQFSDPIDTNFAGPIDGICGSPAQPSSDPLMGNMYQLKKLKERFPNLSVIASIGGYDFSNAFHDYIESPSLRSQLVASCVDLLKAYPDIFDGFDIDLEYPCISTDIPCGDNITPTSDDKGNFAALIQEFRLQMGPSPILSIATSADLTKIQALDFEKLDPVLDFYNIMTYDFTGGEYAVLYTGHHTQLRYNPSDPVDYRHTLSAENATNLFVANGASPSKINIGVAFYGRGFSIDYINQTNPFADSLGATTEGTWQAGVFDYADIMNNYITDNNSYYDNVSDSSFILDNEKGLFITYDSIRSVMAKTQFVRDNGFYGVFGWQVSQDSEDFQLLQAMGD